MDDTIQHILATLSIILLNVNFVVYYFINKTQFERYNSLYKQVQELKQELHQCQNNK